MQIQQQQQWAHALPFLSPQSCISGSIFNAVSGQCRFVVLWGTGSPLRGRGPLVTGFFMLCLLKSLVHRETWRLCCTAPCWHRLWHSLGFQVCMGRVRAMAVPARMQTSPIITGGTLARSGTSSAACWSSVIITRGTEQHWRGSVLILRRKAYEQLKEKKKAPTLPLSEKVKSTNTASPFTLLVSSSLKNSSLKIFSRKPIATKSETFLPRCSQTGRCMDVWKLDYTSLYEPQCPLTPKLAASSTAAPEQRYVMLRGWGTEHGGDVCDRVCCCPGVKCPMQPLKSMQPLKEWARARCSVLGAGKSLVPTPEQRQRVPVIPLRDLPWTELGLPRSVSCCHPRWGLLRDLAPPAAAAGAGGEGLWWKAPSRGVRMLFNTDVLCTANQTHEPKCDQCLVSLKTKGYLGAVSALRIFSDPGQDKTCCFLQMS